MRGVRQCCTIHPMQRVGRIHSSAGLRLLSLISARADIGRLPRAGHLKNLDRAGCAIDLEHGAIDDPMGSVLDRDDAGNAKLPRDDYGVAHQRAYIDNHGARWKKQRSPRWVGQGCNQDIAGIEAARSNEEFAPSHRLQ